MDRAGALEQSVRQRRFAVIDVRDDAEVARKLNSHGSGHYAGAAAHGQLVRTDLLAEMPEKSLDRVVRCRCSRCEQRLPSVEIGTVNGLEFDPGAAARKRTVRSAQTRTGSGHKLPAKLLSGSDRRSGLPSPLSEHPQELCFPISGEE